MNNFLRFNVLRFDNAINVDNKGVVTSDNPNGKNGWVCVYFINTKWNIGYFEVMNDPNTLDLFKNCHPLPLNDLDMCIRSHERIDDWTYFHVHKNSKIEAFEVDDAVGDGKHLNYVLDGKNAFSNSCGFHITDCFCGGYDFGRYFSTYANRYLNEIVRITNNQIINPITKKVYGDIIDDTVYKNDHMEISMKDLGIEVFYQKIIKDIKKNKKELDKSIHSFKDLYDFLNASPVTDYVDMAETENIKNVKFYKLYDKMYKKGKSMLVPKENSKFVGYYLYCTAEVFMGCPPCECGYVNTKQTFFFEKRENEVEFPNIEPKTIRKNGILSDEFTLSKNNDIENPKIEYVSSSGETIELTRNNAMIILE